VRHGLRHFSRLRKVGRRRGIIAETDAPLRFFPLTADIIHRRRSGRSAVAGTIATAWRTGRTPRPCRRCRTSDRDGKRPGTEPPIDGKIGRKRGHPVENGHDAGQGPELRESWETGGKALSTADGKCDVPGAIAGTAGTGFLHLSARPAGPGNRRAHVDAAKGVRRQTPVAPSGRFSREPPRPRPLRPRPTPVPGRHRV
jgi:hypothetical protein